MKAVSTLIATLALTSGLVAGEPSFDLKSPDGRIDLRVDLSKRVYYSVRFGGTQILLPSPLSMDLGNGAVIGDHPHLKDHHATSQRGKIGLPWGHSRQLDESFNELELSFDGDFSIVFRAYDDGVAYRFRTTRTGEITVVSEEAQWNLAAAYSVWGNDSNSTASSFESLYTQRSFADWKDGSYSYSPIMLEHPDGPRVLICDSDLSDYPGLYLQKVGETNRFEVRGLFPGYPRKVADGSWCHFDRIVTEAEPFIARTRGTREFPWRVTVVAASDRELLDSELVTKLARPSQVEDTAWLKPGHAAWDWWCDWNLDGVDFRTGINTETYRHYVDFAAENGIPYLVVDEGWSNAYDLQLLNPNLDLPGIVDYARQKGVRIVLWCTWKTLVDQWSTAFDLFTKLGVAGIKVDFFDRDDQVAVASVEAIAKEAASRHLFVDFHGCRPLAGLQRTYPNIFNFEGVRGNEYNKFNKEPPNPTYNTALCFTRGMVGTMDFTPGGMRNVSAAAFAPNNSQPEVIGTRCHQLAMYVAYAAPIQMLCDSPSAYRKAPDFLHFLCDIPSTWDESRALESRAGELVAIARRSGDTWFVGLLGGAAARTVELDLSFVGTAPQPALLASDSPNSDRFPTDYLIRPTEIVPGKPFKVTLAPGGGGVLKIGPHK